MRTLHIDTGREMRGGQWQVLYLLEGLAAAGHPATLLAQPGSPLYDMGLHEGLDVRPVGLAAVARLSRAVDLTHAHDARAHTLAALAARSPRVVSRRVAFPVRRGLLSRWKYRRAAQFLAVSQCVRRTMVEAGVPAKRVSVVYDGVPLRPASPGGSWLLAPLTDDPRKGAALLREAAALADVEVRFSANLEEDLPRSAAFVYITHQEGLGSGVLLAMSAGVPVVASRVGGLPEVVEHARTGLLVENTPEAIATGLRRVLENRAEAQGLAACARRNVAERFSAEIMVRATLEVYARVLGC
jgi:glycosyltransferase involved in cell wall biosynthesis